MGLGQIVRRHLKMSARGIHAAQHDLIIQHQLPDQFGSGNLERPVATRDAGEHIHPIQSQRIEKIELQFGAIPLASRIKSMPPIFFSTWSAGT